MQHLYIKLERFLLEHHRSFDGVYIITLDNTSELNFVNRGKLEWGRVASFSTAGLKLGVFECFGKKKVKQIDNPYKIISTNPAKVPSKSELKRKINYTVKTGEPLILSHREKRWMKRFGLRSKYNLDRIDKINVNSRKSKLLVEKLRKKKQNIFLKEQKRYEDQKIENIKKKMEAQDRKLIRGLDDEMKRTLGGDQIEEWARLTGKGVGRISKGVENQKNENQIVVRSAKKNQK